MVHTKASLSYSLTRTIMSLLDCLIDMSTKQVVLILRSKVWRRRGVVCQAVPGRLVRDRAAQSTATE